MIKVSVIVPVYNAGKYIAQCLDSLTNQTLADIQIILVNDGSTDDSEAVIARYLNRPENSGRMLYIKKENAGAGAARNAGLEKASGEYVGFVDADDYVEPSMYARMYNAAGEAGADLVECAYLQESAGKAIIKTVRAYTAENALTNTRFSVWNKIIRRELLEAGNIRFPEDLNYEDSEFVCKLVPFVRGTAVINEPLYHYIQHSGTRYHSYNEKVRDIFRIYENIRRFYKEINVYDTYKDQLEYIHIASRLGGSFSRIIRISDGKTRRKILQENWKDLIQNYPGWKRNRFLRVDNSFRNIYFRTVNRFTYGIYAVFFRITGLL